MKSSESLHLRTRKVYVSNNPERLALVDDYPFSCEQCISNTLTTDRAYISYSAYKFAAARGDVISVKHFVYCWSAATPHCLSIVLSHKFPYTPVDVGTYVLRGELLLIFNQLFVVLQHVLFSQFLGISAVGLEGASQ
jgi:hypothetical protein